MTELMVLAFDSELAAFEVRNKLIELQRQHLVQLEDAAVAVRDGEGRLQIKQVLDLTAEGAVGGAFWGLLAGILFWMPFMGMAIGSLMGAISGSMTDYGINDQFIAEVSKAIEPRQSALFLLMREATIDRILEEIQPWKPRLLRTNLSREQEARLRQSFSDASFRVHEENLATRAGVPVPEPGVS